MHVRRLKGVIAAVITPVEADGDPNARAFVSWARHLLDNGCDGLNVLGTTGEATSFSLRQRLSLAEAVASAGLPLERLMVGTGAAAVEDAAELTRVAGELGFTGALVLPPFYYKGVTRDGIVRYFARIVQRSAGTIPLYLYNFPLLSGVAFDKGLVERLISEFGDRIAGLKDSSGDVAYAREIAGLREGFDVFPSNEATLASGGAFAGCISATVNVNAPYCARAFHKNDRDALERAVAVRRLFDGKQLVPGVKALAAHIFSDPSLADVLPPLVRWSAEDERHLFRAYDTLLAPQHPSRAEDPAFQHA